MKNYTIAAITTAYNEALIFSKPFASESEAREAGKAAVLSMPHWWKSYLPNRQGYPEIIVKEG
jgi:hypothetical protein